MIRVLLILSLFIANLCVYAAFTHPVQWKLDVIEQTYAGSWCYRPGASPPRHHQCRNATLKMLLDAHINNGRGAGISIAFFDIQDASVLGGAGWADWASVALPVGVCLSGQVEGLDDAYTTTCRFTITDNDHNIPSAHALECTISRPQLRVTDGCYTPPPRRPWLRLSDSTSGVLTIIGLVIALPVFGLYRHYRVRCARQQAKIEPEESIPLVGCELGGEGGMGSAGRDTLHLEAAHTNS